MFWGDSSSWDETYDGCKNAMTKMKEKRRFILRILNNKIIATFHFFSLFVISLECPGEEKNSLWDMCVRCSEVESVLEERKDISCFYELLHDGMLKFERMSIKMGEERERKDSKGSRRWEKKREQVMSLSLRFREKENNPYSVHVSIIWKMINTKSAVCC